MCAFSPTFWATRATATIWAICCFCCWWGRGWRRSTIVITAFATGLVQFLLFPHSALLGASGVVFMMIVLSSFTEMKKGGIPLTMLLVVALYLGSEIADGLTKTDNVSHLTHIVGGVSGIVFGFRLARAKKR